MGSEYINGYSPIFSSLFKSNHDLRFLRGTNADYSVKYTVKSQEQVGAEKALAATLNAVKRPYASCQRAECENPDMTLEEIGKGRARSPVYNMANRCKVDGTTAAFCISTKGVSFVFSHRRADLSPGVLMAIAKGKETAVTARGKNRGGASGGMQVTKYLMRPDRQLAIY